MKTNQILKLAGLVLKEQAIAAQARKLRQKIADDCAAGVGYYSCVTRGHSGEAHDVTLAIDLRIYLNLASGKDQQIGTELGTWQDGEKSFGRLQYKPFFIGQVGGVNVWIESHGEKFELPQPKAQPTAQEAA